MPEATIPTVDVADLHAGGERRERFIATFGRALEDSGFVAVKGHGIAKERIDAAYDAVRRFFACSDEDKRRSEFAHAKGQRGFTCFGKEHAKGETAPDLKEFFQVGRPDVGADHPIHALYGPNSWPDDLVPDFGAAMTSLFLGLDGLGQELLAACAAYLGDDEAWYRDAVHEGKTPAASARAPTRTSTSLRCWWGPPSPVCSCCSGTEPGCRSRPPMMRSSSTAATCCKMSPMGA